MSTATCPKCHRQVSLPATDDHSVWVRCPLCSEQYSLRMALDHVPPALEILGPVAGAEMAVHDAMPMHGEMGAHADTLAHPEHAANLTPSDAGYFQQADHGSNGEQPIDLEPASPSGHPPALDQANGQQAGASEHLVDFDLETGEHAEHAEFAEHDPAGAGLRQYHGEHTIEPSSLDNGSGEFSGEGDPEFRVADDESGDGADEHHAMGGIATLVQTAPPARKRRKAPLAVKLIGVVLFFGFGFLGCYLVYGAFLWMHSDQFHLKQYFPKFLQNRIADEPAAAQPKHKALERPTPGSLPAGTQTAQTGAPDSATKNPATNNPAAVSPPKKPVPGDVAGDKSAPIESSEDPLKTPPPDLDKPNSTKPDSIAPPKLDAGPTPFDDVKPPVAPTPSTDSTEKPATEKPATQKPATAKSSGDKTPDKPASGTPNKPAPTLGKSVTDKPENPSAIPPAVNPYEIPSEKPTKKPADNPKPVESKSPIAAELANVDAAITATNQTAENLKTTAVPGAEPKTVLRAKVANYKAMSHLVTELGAIDASGADAESAARIKELRKKAAALAESMGSPAERNTTELLAGKWIASASRKESGVVVVGTLVKVEPSGKGFAAHIKMPSDSKEMTFTTTKKPTAADGSLVVVLGLLNADNGGTAVEIVSPSDERAPK